MAVNTSGRYFPQQPLHHETSNEPTLEPPGPAQLAFAAGGSRVTQVGRDYRPTIITGKQWVLYEQIPRADIDSVVETFVKPPGYQRAHELLRGGKSPESIVVICDDFGIGRRSAAVHLLSNGGTLPVHEVQPDWESPRADALPTTKGHNFLLDLTDTEQGINERFGQSLKAVAAELHENDARLVITVTADKWAACRNTTTALVEPLDIPEQLDVLKRHLRHDPGELPVDAIEAPLPAPLQLIVKTLKNNDEPPRRVVDLAKAMRKHSRLNDAAVAKISDEFRHWEGFLKEQFSRRDASTGTMTPTFTVAWRRVLLIAAAVFDGAPSEIVFQAAHKLLNTINAKPESDELITGPELSELLADIKGRNKNGHITINDRHPDLDIAVLNRVWEQRPGLQKVILTWITKVTAENGIAAGQQDRVADVLSKFAVSQRTTRVLEVIQPWIAGTARQHKLAVKMLEQLATSPDIGSAIRDRLYRWAITKQDDNAHLHRAVAAVCGGRLGETHLAVALVRLRYLAVSKNTTVQQATADAVRKIASSQDRAMYILKQALEWAKDSDLQAAGSFVVMELLRPVDEGAAVGSILAAAKADTAFKKDLQDAWRSLLDNSNTRSAAVVLSKTWQDSADRQFLDAETVIEVLAPGLHEHGHKEGVARAFIRGDSPTCSRLVTHLMALSNSRHRVGERDERSNSAAEGAQ